MKRKLEWTCKRCRGNSHSNSENPLEDLQEQSEEEGTKTDTETQQEEQSSSCGECRKKFNKRIKPMKCNTCSTCYHKTTCTGETRWTLDKLIKEGKPWSCKKFRDNINGNIPTTDNRAREDPEEGDTNNTSTEQEQPNTEQVIPKKCSANCGSAIRKGTDFLICSKCELHFHKQQKCSKMPRKQVESLNRNTWECLGCQDTESNTELSKDQEQEANYRIRRTKMDKMNILQFNVDTLASKLEELKLLLKEENIHVFLIQETKLIKKDKDPKIPGYTTLRKDRKQTLSNEENRGGGLIIGIRHDTPFKEIKTRNTQKVCR